MKMLFYSIMYKKVRVYLEGIHYYTLWVILISSPKKSSYQQSNKSYGNYSFPI